MIFEVPHNAARAHNATRALNAVRAPKAARTRNAARAHNAERTQNPEESEKSDRIGGWWVGGRGYPPLPSRPGFFRYRAGRRPAAGGKSLEFWDKH